MKAPREVAPFLVLDAAVPAEYARWCALWARCPGREVAATPAYACLSARPEERVIGVSPGLPDGGILFPLILRPLSVQPWASPSEDGWDSVTPYGYGGAFAWNCDAEVQRQYWAAFSEWTKKERVVCTFARLSLFPEQLAQLPVPSVADRKNVIRTLQVEPEVLWRDYAHKVRKNVSRARRESVEIRLDEHGNDLGAFFEIYKSTLDRRGAAVGYYFERGFFEELLRRLPGQAVFFDAFAGGRIVCSELVLVSAYHIYSFLGGTLAEFFPLRPNDLLKHQVIAWGRAQGKHAFVLGGGYQDSDGIFEYKLAFAPTGASTFRVVRWTHDPGRYASLVARRADWESGQRNWTPRLGFFPEYRAPSALVV